MNLSFPPHFLFGVADADLQVIGEKNTLKEEHSAPTMWSHFAETSGKVSENHSPLEGIDRYHRFEEDAEIMVRMGVKHYRTSVSMARLFTTEGTINQAAVKWYQTYFKKLTDNGIKLYITLYHWELPQYLSDRGGWKERSILQALENHAQAVYDYLGEYITEYFILNEPWASAFLGYYEGVHAPGETSLRSSLLAAHHLLLAQGKVYQLLHNLDTSLRISTVLNFHPCYPLTSKTEDRQATRFASGMNSSWFMDPLFKGAYPEYMVEHFADDLPHFSKEDLEVIAVGDKLHALGVNYYNGRLIASDPTKRVGFKTIILDDAPKNDLGWPIYLPPHYPEGLYDLLHTLYQTYAPYGLKRLYITENGSAFHPQKETVKNEIHDDRRIHYLFQHLKQVHKALEKGIPVEGYFVWTLMDNYEWGYGYTPESSFGLIHVDRVSMQRVWKKSAYWYQDVLQKHYLSPVFDS